MMDKDKEKDKDKDKDKEKDIDGLIIKAEALMAISVEFGFFTLREIGEFMQIFICPHCKVNEDCPLQECYTVMRNGMEGDELKDKIQDIAKKQGWPPLGILGPDETPTFLKIPKK